jgi:hypothetical protein
VITWDATEVPSGDGEVRRYTAGDYVTEVWCPAADDGAQRLFRPMPEPEPVPGPIPEPEVEL